MTSGYHSLNCLTVLTCPMECSCNLENTILREVNGVVPSMLSSFSWHLLRSHMFSRSAHTLSLKSLSHSCGKNSDHIDKRVSNLSIITHNQLRAARLRRRNQSQQRTRAKLQLTSLMAKKTQRDIEDIPLNPKILKISPLQASIMIMTTVKTYSSKNADQCHIRTAMQESTDNDSNDITMKFNIHKFF